MSHARVSNSLAMIMVEFRKKCAGLIKNRSTILMMVRSNASNYEVKFYDLAGNRVRITSFVSFYSSTIQFCYSNGPDVSESPIN